MQATGESAPRPPVGGLLEATAAQLRSRRDDLEPLVAQYDRLQEIHDSFGDVPDDVDDRSYAEDSAGRQYTVLVRSLHAMRGEVREWIERLEPLVAEYEQILHVLLAVDSAATVTHASRRRSRGARAVPGRATSGIPREQRLDELRTVLERPRSRADIAEHMGISPSRVTALLDELAQAGEVVEIRDPEHAGRKLWALAEPVAKESDDGGGELSSGDDGRADDVEAA